MSPLQRESFHMLYFWHTVTVVTLSDAVIVYARVSVPC